MNKTINLVIAGLLLSGCISEDEPHQPSVSEVRKLLDNSVANYPTKYGFDCEGDGNNIYGCYVMPSCYKPSSYVSTSSRTVYGVGRDKLTAYVLDYLTDNCSGKPILSFMSAGIWSYSASYDENLDQGELAVNLTYYQDERWDNSSTPAKGVTYRAHFHIDNGKKLCLSDGLIDATRPLKFMSQSPGQINFSKCATAM
ncbi:hypothetical protein [Vibrio sp. WXL210]|uniref:hypothetical protein n=1 Tax=Vibrio sp. WXL210 TaxID=3450709 RepID=UPI003EC54AC5